MKDPFEESLRDLLKSDAPVHDDDACLDRVLKKANRRVGASDVFVLLGRWMEALMIGINKGSPHLSPTSRAKASENKAD